MKYIITLTLALITAGALAQTDTTFNPSDTIKKIKTDTTKTSDTEIDFGNVKVIVKDKKKYKVTKDSIGKVENENWDYEDEKSYPAVDFIPSFGIGVAGFSQELSGYSSTEIPVITSNASLDLDYGKCRNYIINGNVLIDFTKNIGILTGFGFEFNRFVFKENLQVSPKDGAFVTDSVTSFSSYKFKTNYVQVPLMLKLQTNDQNFQFAVGGIFSYNIGSKVKHEFSLDNADYETTIKGNYNVAPIKLSLGARVAYKGIGLYFNYGLTEMNDNQITSPDGRRNLMPFSAGITLGGL